MYLLFFTKWIVIEMWDFNIIFLKYFHHQNFLIQLFLWFYFMMLTLCNHFYCKQLLYFNAFKSYYSTVTCEMYMKLSMLMMYCTFWRRQHWSKWRRQMKYTVCSWWHTSKFQSKKTSSLASEHSWMFLKVPKVLNQNC